MEGDFSKCLWLLYSLVIAEGQMCGCVSYVFQCFVVGFLWGSLFGFFVWCFFFINTPNKELENIHREKAYTGQKMLGDKLTYFQVGYFYW